MQRVAILVSGLFLFLINGLSWADATIEWTTQELRSQRESLPDKEVIQRYQGAKEWILVSRKSPTLSSELIPRETIIITRLDKGFSWRLDPKNRTYTEEVLRKEDRKEIGMPKFGFTVEKTGASETINGFPCEEYRITFLFQTKGPKGDSQIKHTIFLWTTPETAIIAKAEAEQQRFLQLLLTGITGITPALGKDEQLAPIIFGPIVLCNGMDYFPLELERMLNLYIGWQVLEEMEAKERAAVKEEMAKIKGYPIRSVVNWTFIPNEKEILFSRTSEVKVIKAELIPPNVFEIPSGYVKK